MKSIRVCLQAGILLVSAGIQAQEPPDVNVFSFADNTCTAWTRSADNAALREIYANWFRGFVSGYNFGNSGNQVPFNAMPNPSALAARVDKFCRDNPQSPFVGAIIPLIQEIREHRLPPAPVAPQSDQ